MSSILSVQIVEATLTGVGRHAIDVCEQLLDLGHRVVLFNANDRMDSQFARGLDKLDSSKNSNHFTRFDCPMKRSIGLADLGAIRQVREYLESHKNERIVCHGHSSKGGAVARLAAAKIGVPSIYTPNAISSMNPKAAMWKRVAFAKLEKWLASRGQQHVIATGQDEYEHLRDFVGIPESQMSIIANGISECSLPSQEQARDSLGIPHDKIVAGFVGRMASQKGLDVLMRSWTKVRQQLPNALLALIGNGPLDTELRAQAEKLEHGDSILWLGEQPGQISMPAFDFFVLPSRYEGLPYVLMESLAASLPIVVTDRASAGSVVIDGENGFIVPVEDDVQLADRIIELASNSELRNQFSAASTERAGLFTARAMVESVVNVYESLL